MPLLIIAGVSFPSSAAILRDEMEAFETVCFNVRIYCPDNYIHTPHFAGKPPFWRRRRADSPDIPARASAADRVHARGTGGSLIAVEFSLFHSIRYTLQSLNQTRQFLTAWIAGRSPNQPSYTAFPHLIPFSHVRIKMSRAHVEDTLVLFWKHLLVSLSSGA